ncbi:hypothetical protein MtrunA17_Chr7g0259111 [Medicago truncatula]|uniref:Uncharacterized protein n=2 Tax=Medicago truncatula TaxID=3880 RepID=A0A396H8C5_MEDTR|nr:hypothetical protein MtrunA17_Chr7g0259111 [Medicago truncatula]
MTMVVVRTAVGQDDGENDSGLGDDGGREENGGRSTRIEEEKEERKKMDVVYLHYCPCFKVEMSKLPLMSELCPKICV